ncbi:MAG: hypothetical protein AB1486_08935 [Planctomycetota bacterium]
MQTSTCTHCGHEVPHYDGVHLSDGKRGRLGFVCGRCWARILSEETGEEIPHLEIAPIVIEDPRGGSHEFHFRYNPSPRGIRAFEAREESSWGYQFGIMAEEGEPSESLVGRLLTRIRRGLAYQHLEPCDITEGRRRIKDRVVRGHIEWDAESEDQLPCVVIDGETIPWPQFGKMVMQFEGFQFRTEILDFCDEA